MPSNRELSSSHPRGSVIIFDSNTQTVSIIKHKQLEGIRVIKTQTAPKWDSYVPIYAGEQETERLAATLNLDNLGWTTNMKRLCGKFSHICVVDYDSPPASVSLPAPGSRPASPLLQAS